MRMNSLQLEKRLERPGVPLTRQKLVFEHSMFVDYTQLGWQKLGTGITVDLFRIFELYVGPILLPLSHCLILLPAQ